MCSRTYTFLSAFVPIITHLITWSIIHQNPLPLASRTHIPPLGRMAAPNKARINGHLILGRVCVCVTSADSPGVWPRTRSASASFISVYDCVSVCAEKQYTTCAPLPCPQPADALKVKTHTQRKGLSTMQSYQSQPRLVSVLGY